MLGEVIAAGHDVLRLGHLPANGTVTDGSLGNRSASGVLTDGSFGVTVRTVLTQVFIARSTVS